MRRVSRSATALLTLLAACSSDSTEPLDDCISGTCDEIGKLGKVTGVEDSACKAIETEVGDIPFSELNDSVANALFKNGDDCPQSFSEILKKLHRVRGGEADYEECINSMVVSEDSQNRGEAGEYRVVTSACGGFGDVLLSTFGVHKDITAAGLDSKAVELIGFDESRGIFNYYDVGGGSWNYVGSSEHMRKGGRCGGCHVQGGLVMKELHSPWIYWEEFLTTEGLTGEDGLFANTVDSELGVSILGRHDDLGGNTMEGMVHDMNSEYVIAKVGRLKEKLVATGSAEALRELLEPAFCTKEFNLDSLSSEVSADSDFSVNLDSLMDPRFYCTAGSFCFDDNFMEGVTEPTIQGSDYLAFLESSQSRVGSGKPDTALPLVYIERGDIDSLWVAELVNQNIIDRNTAVAILAVDHTRPIFSAERCGLLGLVTDIDPDAPVSLVDQVWTMLTASVRATEGAKEIRTPEADFAKALASNVQQNTRRVANYVNSCSSRDSGDFLEDMMAVVALNRKEALKAPVMENKTMLVPTDNQTPHPDARLSRLTCELVSSYADAATDCQADDGRTGTCVDVDVTSCGEPVTGKCPGPGSVQCCLD